MVDVAVSLEHTKEPSGFQMATGLSGEQLQDRHELSRLRQHVDTSATQLDGK